MEDLKLTISDLKAYIIIINIILGVLFGVMPLIAGLVLKNTKLGVIGFAASIIGGTLLGVFLAFPIAAIFLFLITRDMQRKTIN